MHAFRLTGAVVFCLLTAWPAPGQPPRSPYAGQQTRTIKALSPQQIGDYLAGRGMGLAKAAELNHYPGPRHVLDLAGPLGLKHSQLSAVKAVHRRMKTRAVGLGRRIVALEGRLDRLFASGEISGESLKALLTRIARLAGELRHVHLAAHLATKRLLTPAQVARYDALRGYGQDGGGYRHHGGH